MFQEIRQRIAGVLPTEWAARFRAAEGDPARQRAATREYARYRGARLVEGPTVAPSPAEAERLARKAQSDALARRLEEGRRKSERLAWEAKRREIDAGGR